MLVRLYVLLYCINISGIVLIYRPANMLTWIGFQGLVCGLAIFFYTAFYKGVNAVLGGSADKLYQVLCVLLLLGFSIILALKIFYSITFVSKKNNPQFLKLYQFLTTQNFGKQFTVTTLSFLIVVGYLVLANLTGHYQLDPGSVNLVAFALNSLMCTFTLYAFSKYFNG